MAKRKVKVEITDANSCLDMEDIEYCVASGELAMIIAATAAPNSNMPPVDSRLRKRSMAADKSQPA